MFSKEKERLAVLHSLEDTMRDFNLIEDRDYFIIFINNANDLEMDKIILRFKEEGNKDLIIELIRMGWKFDNDVMSFKGSIFNINKINENFKMIRLKYNIFA